MINLLYNIGQVLGVTIIHSLWQGLFIYFVLRLIFSSVPQLSSAKKYNLSAIGLAGMAGWFIYTFCVQAYAYDWRPAQVLYNASTNLDLLKVQVRTLNEHADFKSAFYNSIKVYLPYVSVIYAIGLVLNLGRLILALKNIRLIKKNIIKAENMQDRINEFCAQLKIRRKVQVAFSRLVEVPCVIGYIKPLLLLPITLTFQLSAEEIETIVLHELSHIKRNDYLVNMIQQIISVLLFFNPFAQLISNIISTERENRCDDMVVEKTESPLTYAYALLKLEEVRSTEVKLALAATQNKHHLLNRIERIMKTKTPIGNIRPILVALLLIAGSLSVAWLNPEVKNGKVTFKKIAAIRSASVAEAVPAAEVEHVKPHHKHITVDYADTTKAKLTDDTTKKKIRIIVEDENGNKKEYNSVKDLPEADKNDFYKETMNNDMHFNFDMKMDSNLARINKFYQSDKWKKQLAELQANAMAMSKKFNSEAFKKQTEAMKLNSEAMQKKMKAMNDDIQKKFNSPEFKKRMEEFQQKMNSKEFKEKMKGLSKENADAYFNSPEWNAQVDAIGKQGEEIAKMYDNPEWKKQIDEIAKQGADMAKVYENPAFQKQMEKMAKMYDDPAFQKQMENLSKQAEAFAKNAGDMKFDFNYNSDEKPERKERAEKKERVEKKEKPEVKRKEKVERKERAEKPEKKEQPEKAEAPEQQEF